MKVLGLCGGSGSGKGLVCSYFAELGIASVDTDLVYHRLISSTTTCQKEIVNEFGASILRDGVIDRKRLAEIVFSSEEKRLRLNEIAHRHILNAVREEIKLCTAAGHSGIIVDAPLLFESGFNAECDATLCVLSTDELRIARIVARDNITEEQARIRISAQKPNDWLLKQCDYHIENNASCDILRLEVLKIAKDFFEI